MLTQAPEFESVETILFNDLVEEDRETLFGDRPWLVVIHHALDTYEDATNTQLEIACKLNIDRNPYIYPEPFMHGTYWHNDGKRHHPIANFHTTFGPAGGFLYLAPALENLDLPPRVTTSEEHVMDGVVGLLNLGKIRQPVVKVPINSNTTTIWREIAPSDNVTDAAHAVFAEPGRRSAVSEYELAQ